MEIELVTGVDDELGEAFQRLIPQLTFPRPPPSQDDLRALVAANSSSLLIARPARSCASSALPASRSIVFPPACAPIIEDVIVDEPHHGSGLGEALTHRCPGSGPAKKAPAAVTLTSNPARQAANRLYVRMGFKRRETNAYYLPAFANRWGLWRTGP